MALMNLWALAMLAWLAGVAIQLQQSSLTAKPWAISGLVLSALWVALAIWLRGRVRQRRAVGWCMVWTACALLAWASTTLRAHALLQQALPAEWQDQALLLEGQVEGLPTPRGPSLGFDVAVRRLSLQGESVLRPDLPGRVMLYWQAGDLMQQVKAGQVWRWTVRLQAPISTGNPGGFDAALWMLDKGVRATGSVLSKKGVTRPQLLEDPAHWWSTGAVDRARQSIREAIYRQVPDVRLAGVLAGLTVGDQAAIDREDWNVFRKTGVAHLVSISGMHIAMVGWMGSMLLAWWWRRSPWLMHRWSAPTIQLVSGVVVAAAYSLLAGWGVPAQRTVCMMAVWALLKVAGRPWPWPLVWLASAVVVTMMDPWALYQAGFWLSFVAVGVLMASGSALEAPAPVDPSWLERSWRASRGLVHTQWLTTVSLTPLAAVFFQQVSVVGFFANLFAIPVFTVLITPLALGGMVWSPLWSAAAGMMDGCIKVLGWMAHWPGAATHVAMLPTWLAMLVVPAAAALILPVPWRWRLIGLPALMGMVLLPGRWALVPPPLPGQFSLVAADVGQGTSVLVRTAHHALVFDAGPKVGDRSDAGQRVVVPLLGALGVARLDRLIISHRDTDHVGGAASIVAEVPVALLQSSLEDEHPLRQTLVAGQTLPHLRCEAGQHWQWDGVDFTVLHPSAQDYERRASLLPNALSCAVRIQAKAMPGQPAASAFLAADVEAEQEAAILSRARLSSQNSGALNTQLLVVPHHGSDTSSTEPFLKALQPIQAVIQVGRRNSYGHPSPDVLARYDMLSVARVATPACGAFVWNSGEPPLGEVQALRLDPSQHLRLGHCWRQASRHYWD